VPLQRAADSYTPLGTLRGSQAKEVPTKQDTQMGGDSDLRRCPSSTINPQHGRSHIVGCVTEPKPEKHPEKNLHGYRSFHSHDLIGPFWVPFCASGLQAPPLSMQAPEQTEPDSLIWVDISLFNTRSSHHQEVYVASIC